MQWMHPAFIFSVLEVENENAAAWNEVPAAKKSLAAFHAALSLFSCDQVPPVFYSRLWILAAFFWPQRISKPLFWHTVSYFLRKFGKSVRH